MGVSVAEQAAVSHLETSCLPLQEFIGT